MRKLVAACYIIVHLTGYSTVCAQQTADTVQVMVSGVFRLDESRVRMLARQQDGLHRIAEAYGERGHWNAVITDSMPENGRVRYVQVFEGPPASIHALHDGGSILTPPDVLPWSKRLLRREANRGHPFAQLRIVSAQEIVPGEFSLDAELDTGPLVTIVDVEPVGNHVTRDVVIRRELRHPVPSPYNQDAVELWRRRLLRTGYFASVSEPELFWRDSVAGAAKLAIGVSEGKPNKFEGIVGYQPAPAGADTRGTFTGLVDLVLGNLWGTGRRLAARWERPVEETTTLALTYREPWVAGWPVNAEGRLYVEQRLGYATEEFDIYAGAEVVPELTVGLVFGREVVRSDSIALLGGPRHRGRVIAAEVEYDTRDDALNPSTGHRYRFSWRGSFRTNSVNDPDFTALFGPDAWPEKERTSTVQVGVEHFIGVVPGVTIAAGWHGVQISSSERRDGLRTSDLFRLGGVTTVRGYQQDQFSGDIAAWGNHELRYRVGADSRVFAFIDAGAVRMRRYDPASGETTQISHFPVGYGVGLRGRTGAGLLGIDFGWGRGDTFGQGKVHVRLETVF